MDNVMKKISTHFSLPQYLFAALSKSPKYCELSFILPASARREVLYSQKMFYLHLYPFFSTLLILITAIFKLLYEMI